MGMRVDLEKQFDFIYKKSLDKGLIEHEFDHVYMGISDDVPVLNKDEAEDFTYLSSNDLALSMKIKPDAYTEWFKILFPIANQKINDIKQTVNDLVGIHSNFFMMEGVAWFTHKYVMHGFLWALHKDHHTHENSGFIEKNDSFFLIFATPGILCTFIRLLFW